MKKNVLFSLIPFILVVSCYSQKYKVSSSINNKVSTETFVKKRLLKLPDSLGGNSITGYAILESKIVTNTSEIVKVEIMKLLVKSKEENKEEVDYYHGIDTVGYRKDYDNMVRFKPFLEESFRSLKEIKNNQFDVRGDTCVFGIKIEF
ncbi:hypothetical protein ACFU8T_21250 [Sphingobacterium spiritivorum]|uniref:Uncharacterized protein n=1 Tax=Sphingobacterium spiritivorum ATCC 33861 TaxID=525373 RepID=D7VJV2_SPHSI|nr:hypothetical protein [Sphingobacterium spiritivorum]EFK58554.1 hypothetical protein HMPREF0766_11271 [Sphingobacterium spiritivorum ATCC 33861]QQT34530.1 hypothetical protein I6J01_14590 [Sphingobacterium spiritivorum]WQD35399.1 hypothetical protein U0038_06525 [Sphingobacterium spiritivorum]SUJ00306.1 Uncharacterised protein [Sphingobacterium spiritivorum]